MKTYATLLAGALAAMTFALPAVAADDAAKASMKQADSTYDMTKKQAKADEKSAMAQCDTMSGDAKSQCKKDAEATYKKTMADAEASHDKAKADYKAKSRATGRFAEMKTAPEGAVLFGLKTESYRTTAICSRLSPL